MKMIVVSSPPTQLSRFGRWRWNVLATLFAALVLIALIVRRWRCAEVVEDVGANAAASPARRIVVGSLLASAVLTIALLCFSLTSGEFAAMPALEQRGAASDSASASDGLHISDGGAARDDGACAQCGVVESTREIVADLPAGVVESTGHQGAVGGVEVTVRTKDGVSHLFTAARPGSSTSWANSASWRTGERVIFIAGRSLPSE